MKISLRLTIALIVAATVPLLISSGWSLYTLHRVSTLATSQSETALVELGEEAIRQKAEATARQVELYLDTHPEVDLKDIAQLEANTDLAEIAVQPVGQTGYTAVFDEEAINHFHINPDLIGTDLGTLAGELPEFWDVLAASLDGTPSDGYYDWKDADGQIRPKYMSIIPIGDTRLRVAATTYIDEFSYPVVEFGSEMTEIRRASLTQLVWAVIGVTLLATAGAFVLARQLSQPISQITDAATRVAAGDLSPVQLGVRSDEIGDLAKAFNTMTARIRELLAGMEERTRVLERRSMQLQVAAEVARDTTTIHDLDQLLNQAVTLVRDRFAFYRASIFLLDEQGEYAVLRAATGEAGRQMLEHGHRLKVGEAGVVGYATGIGQPCTTLDIGGDVTQFDRPPLPETCSEIALPLRARGQIIGALEVHIADESAFDEDDMMVLQTTADQLAVAIENARLIQEMQQTMDELETVYRRYTQESWRAFVRGSGRPLGYRYRGLSIEPAAEENPEAREALRHGRPVLTTSQSTENGNGHDSPQTERPAEVSDEAVSALAVPIKLRNQVLGVLNLRFKGEDISQETVLLVEETANRLALALENARLFDQAQRRAVREQLTGEISSRMRETLDMDTILKTTIREIGEALDFAKVEVRMG